MDFSDGRTCAICGAPITNENPDGIGWQCREVFSTARWKVFFENKERVCSYYKPLNEAIMGLFQARFQNTKFRSKFRKEFFASITEQWNRCRFITKKQRTIMKEWLAYDNYDWAMGDRDNPNLTEATKIQSDIFNQWQPSSEETEHIYLLANKLRHQ